MKQFTNQDIENYYDQSEVHYRMFWKLEESMGLHYGIWDEGTRTIADSVLNTNRMLMKLGNITAADLVLDAGCGIGGSAIYIAKNAGCRVSGITLSKKQQLTATKLAERAGLTEKLHFSQQDYTKTNFADSSFDVVWAIESMQTAADKSLFFTEMSRILKPGGRLLVCDIFKPTAYDIAPEKDMHTMLNGWAMTDILSVGELNNLAKMDGFSVEKVVDVTKNIGKSVNAIYVASILGMFGTWAYNLYRRASYFSRIHYKTGLAQHKTYNKGKWGYYLMLLRKR